MKNFKGFVSKYSGPDADWRKIFIVTILLIVFVSAFDVRLFSSINSQDVAQGADNGAGSLDLNKLKQTVEYYKSKEAVFEKIKSGLATSTPSDPSV